MLLGQFSSLRAVLETVGLELCRLTVVLAVLQPQGEGLLPVWHVEVSLSRKLGRDLGF